MKFFTSLLLSLLLITQIACESEAKSGTEKIQEKAEPLTQTRKVEERKTLKASPFPYDLANPAWDINLPDNLQEVSGLAYIEDNEIALVQDENGIIFILDLVTKEITSRHRFKKSGDFEGVEILGETAYVLRSDGDVYQISDYKSDSPIVTSHETALSTSNDTEGLGFDPETGLLLIASKESDKLMGVKYKDKQVVVSFDPQTHSLRPNPFVVIDFKDIKKFLEKNAETKSEKKFADKFDEDKSSSFKPSAIAVHPLSKEIYLLASNGNMLLVLNRKFQIVQAKHLSGKKFPQPEGMCFDAEGNLYISNEGNMGPGNLRKYALQK